MNIYTPNEFCKKVGVTYQTLIKWEKKGKLQPEKNAEGRRYYTEEHLRKCMNGDTVSVSSDKKVLFRKII